MESTRINNPALGSSRVIDKDVVIGGYQVDTTLNIIGYCEYY